YPFCEDMESGTGNWAWGTPWGQTTAKAHSGTTCWTDSPGGLHDNNASTALETRINLSAAVLPVLSYWEQYALETNGDYGYVEVSGDGGNSWVGVSFSTGFQTSWAQRRIDLT